MTRTSDRKAGTAALAALLLLATLAPATAQTPINEFPRDLYEDRLRLQGDAVSFCVYTDSMLADFNIEVAETLAGALLLQPTIVPIDLLVPAEPLDYRIPLTEQELFLMMTGRCDAFMGFTLATGYPEWLRVTRPYFASDAVLVVTDPNYGRLEDIPVDRPIGTRIFSTTDNQLLAYIESLPEERRWRRHPYRNYGIAYERVVDGTVGGSIVWDAAVYRATDGDPEARGIRVIRALPFSDRPVELGIGVRSADPFLEQSLSQAIDSLRADGTLREIAVHHHLAPAEGSSSADAPRP